MGRKRKKELGVQDFTFVDCWHNSVEEAENGKPRNKKWQRFPLDKVKDFANEHNNFNVFATIQRYCVDKRDESSEEGELCIAPIYIDLDANFLLVSEPYQLNDGTWREGKDGLLEMEKVRAEELEGMLPEELMVYVRNFEKGISIPPEIRLEILNQAKNRKDLSDLVWLKNLEISRRDAVEVVNFFKGFGLSEEHIRVWFSGSKGFHIVVNETVAGIKPMPEEDLTGIMAMIATRLETQLNLHCLDRNVMKSKRRQLRLPNSIHHKSKLFKVELTHDELLVDNVDEIRKLARSPRTNMPDYPAIEVFAPRDELVEFVNEMREAWLEAKKLERETPVLSDEVKQKLGEEMPVCVKFLMENGILKYGDRNKATMVLASYFKDIGVPEKEAITILLDWVKKIPKDLTSSNPAEIRGSTVSCVRTVYRKKKYHFGCAFILSLRGEKKNGKYDLIPCAGPQCPAHEEHREEEPAEFMHLSKTGDAELDGKKVATDVLVAGKMDAPYFVPKRVQYICEHVSNCNKLWCVMHKFGGALEREFNEANRILIETTSQNDAQVRGILRHYIHAGCDKVYPKILSRQNVEELLVVPMAERINSVKQEDGTAKAYDDEGNEYVTRKIYSTEKMSANTHYRIEGNVYSHPRNGLATILVNKVTPKEDSISSFKLTPEVIEEFKVFQVPEMPDKTPLEALREHLGTLVEDLVGNVTRVYHRVPEHVALLMTYHSCLHFYFQNELQKRGWMEIIMTGDSGQAKTQMVSRLMDFVGLGSTVDAEVTKRTGLIYRQEQIGDRWFVTWGRYPLADRKLLVIDEFSALNPETFGMLTYARTEGVLKVEGMNNTETNARVRLVLLTNPKGDKTLSDYTHPVEALKDLFDNPADIRRLDMALFLKSGDVPKEVLNQEYVPPERQLITSEALRNSILWAWSRKPEQIIIGKAALRKILKEADRLAEKYSHAKNIPLCDADLNKKIARMSIAVAALVHSTDETHENVIVKPEHVEFVSGFLDRLYQAPNCRFDEYNNQMRQETELTDKEAEEIAEILKKMDDDDGEPISTHLLNLFRRSEALRMSEVCDMMAVEKKLIQKRLRVMLEYHLVKQSKRSGVEKLPKLIEYLKRVQPVDKKS